MKKVTLCDRHDVGDKIDGAGRVVSVKEVYYPNYYGGTVGYEHTCVTPEEESESTAKFADLAFEFDKVKAEFEDDLFDLINFDSIGWDFYDISLELYNVDNGARLSEEAQRFIYDAGFRKVYLNYSDGWEVHYSWYDEFETYGGTLVKPRKGAKR
jgi:hypothetical protein